MKRRAGSVTAIALLLAACTPSPSPSSPPTSVASSTTSTAVPSPSNFWPNPGSPDRSVGLASSSDADRTVTPPAGSGIQRYLSQQLSWGECAKTEGVEQPAGLVCTSFLTPLDWADPDGRAISIAMAKVSATGASQGALFVNPGGPGGSAQNYAQYFDRTGLESWDLIGMDPRGSGESTPVQCDDAVVDAYVGADASPDDQAERATLEKVSADFAVSCRRDSGVLLDHLSTVDNAHDMDLARQLLGQDQLSFFGMSYGTYVGSVYGQLYPQRVRAMVLDSAVALTPDSQVSQAQAFDASLRAFAQWCQTGNCHFGTSPQEALNAIVSYVDGLDAAPKPVGDRTLTQTLAVSGIALYLYRDEAGYESLRNVLEWALVGDDPQYLLRAADVMNARREDGSYQSLTMSFPAIGCVDRPDKGTAAAWQEWDAEQSSSLFGRWMGPDLLCPLWTAEPAPMIDFDGASLPPILVLGNTGDAATPYEDARAMAVELPSAILLTRQGAGHGAFGHTACIDEPVRAYLNDAVVPTAKSCPAS